MSGSLSGMTGETITLENGVLNVPNNPTIHYIEGDGIGVDISPVMIKVVDAAVSKAYDGEKQIHWSEVLAGEKTFGIDPNLTQAIAARIKKIHSQNS